MKKRVINSKLTLKKNTISRLESIKLSGGTGVSTNPLCNQTGPQQGCATANNCNTDGCGGNTGGATLQNVSCQLPCH